MKVSLEKTFPMPGDVDAVWSVLQNIEGVARCMPGAKITERIDDTHFKGTVSVKVGPASMSFKGDIEVMQLDASTHTLRLVGKGSDTSGTSGASMDLTARVEGGSEPGASNLIGISEVTMSGKAAAFGGRMMGSVADQILKQFAGNFAKQVAAVAAQPVAPSEATAAAVAARPAAPSDAAAASVSASAAAPTPTNGQGQSAATHASATIAPLVGAAAAPAPLGVSPAVISPAPTQVMAPAAARAAAPPATPPAPAMATASPGARSGAAPMPVETDADEPGNQINALALLWAIIRDWFRNLFRRKPA